MLRRLRPERLLAVHRVSGACCAGAGAAALLCGAAAGGSSGSRCSSGSSSSCSSSCAFVKSALPSLPSDGMSEKLEDIFEAEARVLGFMNDTPYEVYNVPVRLDVPARCFLRRAESEYTIRTIVVGKEHRDKTPLVLVHGFMMGAAGFFKWLPLLARERTVYAVDIIGMGGSGRPPFEPGASSPAEAEEILVSPFEQWAAAMDLPRFVLLGHSFGGFVAAAWATRRPESVACLGLLSPLLGFSEERVRKILEPSEDATWQQHAFKYLVETAWANHITPQSLVRWFPGFKGYFERTSIRRFSSQGWVKDMSAEEGRVLTEYLTKTLDTPASTEATATVCFGPMLKPKAVNGLTIKQRLAQLDVPMFAVYGDRDWMDKARAAELPKCDFVELPGSGHHLYFDNPIGLTTDVLLRIQRY
eukprot:TRINITY_DN19123_c0_g1_i1.p1 TRINITY_DN19123_c0_g1~~TRINITY_DN19123_c0_g1_i1.p1  ORF type:complete len:416 (-),score=89.64 TRINITY_DN19123_c0_g1_i1:84-1331(-)